MKANIFMPLMRIAEHFSERVSEWILSGMLVTWGLQCLHVPAEFWNDPIYAGIAKIMPKTMFGVVALSLGLGRMVALYINGAKRRTPHARAVGAFLSCFLWMQLTLGLLSAGSALGNSIIPWVFVAEMWNVYRAARDARLADMKLWPVEGAIRGDAKSA